LRDEARAGAADTAPARTIELVYVDDCPNYETQLAHLRELLSTRWAYVLCATGHSA
jgi:hypothetical protein